MAGQVNYNNDDPVSPLWMLQKSDYWFHHFNGVSLYFWSHEFMLILLSVMSSPLRQETSLNCVFCVLF